jgi:hypothetical protein
MGRRSVVHYASSKGEQGESFSRFYIGQRLWWRGERAAARGQFAKVVEEARKLKHPGVVVNWAAARLIKLDGPHKP